METLIAWITEHASHAHFFIFFAILLAGFNIPISADLLILTSAILAATIIPEHTIHLYLAVFLGCYFSSWIAYWLGRLAGNKLAKFRWFSKLLSEERLAKTQKFYEKHGLITLLVGRFIPFGVRNCIFMTTGMSKLSFTKFILWDFIACLTWSLVTFSLFYKLGENYQFVYTHLKTVNIIVGSAFGVTLIGVIWYKRSKKRERQQIKSFNA